MKIGEHIGILLLFKLPKSNIKDNEVYSIVWDFMMRLEEQLARAFMYYDIMDENKFEQPSSEIGIFLPFRHFEHQLEKNILYLGCNISKDYLFIVAIVVVIKRHRIYRAVSFSYE